MLSRPIAVIVVELRGLAADTIVEGAEVWTTPIKVVGERLLAAVDGAHLARIGPHKFGLVVSIESQKAALSMAERVVAVCRTPIGEGSDEVRIGRWPAYAIAPRAGPYEARP